MKTRIIYNRKGSTNKHGEAPVTLEVTIDGGKRIYHKLNVVCKPDAWDVLKCRINKKDSDHATKNMIIDSVVSDTMKYLHNQEFQKKTVTAESLRNFFKPVPTIETFNDFFKANLGRSRVKVNIHFDTIQSRRNTLNLFNEYNNKVYLDEMNSKVVDGFITFLKKRGDAVNTIAKHLKNLRSIIVFAQYDGVIKEGKAHDPFKGIKVKRERSEQKFSLTFEQVDDIKKLNITEDEGNLYHTWKMFLFACRTAFRISDVLDLRYKHCKETPNGWVIIKKSVKDSGGTYRINLNQIQEIFGDNMAFDIMAEYMAEGREENDKIFPVIAEDKIKFALDTIAWTINLNKNLTFHIARHTCATHLAAKDVGLHKIMRIGGWNDPRTIKSYIDLADDLLGRF